eukprot:IDg16005t1
MTRSSCKAQGAMRNAQGRRKAWLTTRKR